MSKKTRCHCKYKYPEPVYYDNGGYFNIYNLCILILIVLQFGRKDSYTKKQLIDNSILFIITLFLLVDCSCKSMKYNSYN